MNVLNAIKQIKEYIPYKKHYF